MRWPLRRSKTSEWMRREWAAALFILLAVAAGIGLLSGTAAGRGNGPGGSKSQPAPSTSEPTGEPTTGPTTAPAATSTNMAQQREADARLAGEKRFHNNCGRCHMAPEKFPPRVMAMVVRHMRVRANITDEDMRLILNYMTQ
jgi:mono/diheme cytochrome c family protein